MEKKLTPAAKAAVEELEKKEEAKGKIKLQTHFVSPNSGWKRLFYYYKPHFIIFIMVL